MHHTVDLHLAVLARDWAAAFARLHVPVVRRLVPGVGPARVARGVARWVGWLWLLGSGAVWHGWHRPVLALFRGHTGQDAFNVEVAIGAEERAQFNLGQVDLVHVLGQAVLAAEATSDLVFLAVLGVVVRLDDDRTFSLVQGDTAFFRLVAAEIEAQPDGAAIWADPGDWVAEGVPLAQARWTERGAAKGVVVALPGVVPLLPGVGRPWVAWVGGRVAVPWLLVHPVGPLGHRGPRLLVHRVKGRHARGRHARGVHRPWVVVPVDLGVTAWFTASWAVGRHRHWGAS